jgi:hypothetical protein
MRILEKVIVPALLFGFGMAAFAQFGPQYDPGAVSALIDRVHVDLDHAYGAWHFTHDDRERLNHAEKELRDFARKWNHNHFDKGELDDAIASIQHVLDNNHMTGRARDAISDDLGELRRMREAYDHHEIGRR